jgi:TonB-linked SusC/RagA family outer membrane protein
MQLLSRLSRLAVSAMLAVALLSLVATGVSAQNGTIVGRVLDRTSARPLAGAQVFIETSGLGTLSDAAGRYALANVPAGQVTVTAQIIGYGLLQQTTTVAAGQTVALNFNLSQEALGLDEIVVTGTPGGTQRVAIGNVVERVDMSSRVEVSPSVGVQELISSRTPGVTAQGLNGMVGGGTSMRIRGVSSLAQGSNPLLFVDGVRVDNNPESGPELRAGRAASRMNDFNPDDIESIEIIKGPAAATLYGTEASNGVIHIITKKGVSGAPTLDVTTRQGANFMYNPEGRFFDTYWYDNGTSQLIDVMNVYNRWQSNSTINPSGDPIFSYGRIQGYDAAVRGGTDLIRYYASVGWDDETGIVDYNWQKALSGRANISVTPSDKWDVDVSLGIVRSETRFAQAATGYGIWEAIVWTRPDTCPAMEENNFLGTGTTSCFRYLPPTAADDIDSRQKIGRFTGSFTVTNKPLSWLTQRLTSGVDYSSDLSSQLFPRVGQGDINYFGSRGAGEKTVTNASTQFNTVDYAATASFQLTPEVRSSTSGGVQYYQRLTQGSTSFGQVFPSPLITTVSGAATRDGGETWVENKTLGTYFQQEFGWRDRVFITGAVRADANSAFGANFDAAIYPKFSATWLISEEDFFGLDFVQQLRLRYAWGKAGMQPGTFDAVTLYEGKTGPGGSAVLTPLSRGDANLKPEVSAEHEIGFDATLFDRLSVELTHYRRRTTDALFQVPVRPSSGFVGSQLANLAETKNWGTELSINANVLERDAFGLDLGMTFAHTRNEIVDIGDMDPGNVRGTAQHAGYPINGHYARIALSGDLAPGASTPTNMMCDGGTGPLAYDLNGDGTLDTGAMPGGDPVPCGSAPRILVEGRGPEPTWSGSQFTTLRIGQNLRLNSVIEFAGGHLAQSMIAGATRSMRSTPNVNPLTDARIAYYLTSGFNQVPGDFKAGFARLREVSANYTLPDSWASRAGASRASITVAMRNLGFLWVEQPEIWGAKVFDPEQTGHGDDSTVNQVTEIAPTSRILVTMRVTF